MAYVCFSIVYLFFLYVFLIVIHLLEKLCLRLRNQRLESASSYELFVPTSVSDGSSCLAPGRNNFTECLTVITGSCNGVHNSGRSEYGHKTTFYHGSMDPAQRTFVQKQWSKGEVNIICATVTFGMGINKPDVLFVIDYSLPKSIEGYHQECGRAGRDGQPSSCVLYYSYNDHIRFKHMISRGDVVQSPLTSRYNGTNSGASGMILGINTDNLLRMVKASRDFKLFSGNCTVKSRFPSSAIASKQLKIGATTAKGSLTSGKQFTPALSAAQLESIEDWDCHKLELDVSLSDQVQIPLNSTVKSTLELMLDNLQREDEGENAVPLPPALPLRPKSNPRARPPSAKRPVTIGQRTYILEEKDCHKLMQDPTSELDVSLSDQVQIPLDSTVKSTLELMLDNLRRKDEGENAVDLLPMLPLRPKSNPRAGPPYAKRPFTIGRRTHSNISEEKDCHKLMHDSPSELDVSLDDQLQIPLDSPVKSTLELMLDNLRRKDEGENAVDFPPTLPLRPKSNPRARPPSARRSLSIGQSTHTNMSKQKDCHKVMQDSPSELGVPLIDVVQIPFDSTVRSSLEMLLDNPQRNDEEPFDDPQPHHHHVDESYDCSTSTATTNFNDVSASGLISSIGSCGSADQLTLQFQREMRLSAAKESLKDDVSCCQWKHRFKAWKKDLRTRLQKLGHSEMGKKCKRWGKTIQPKKCQHRVHSVVINLC